MSFKKGDVVRCVAETSNVYYSKGDVGFVMRDPSGKDEAPFTNGMIRVFLLRTCKEMWLMDHRWEKVDGQ